MKTIDLSSLKLYKSVEISYEQACELLKNTEKEGDFKNLNESTITDSVTFECVQNRSYSLVKVSKKGTILYRESEYETKSDIGVFEVEMHYDYRHPSNFAQDRNNCLQVFRFAL